MMLNRLTIWTPRIASFILGVILFIIGSYLFSNFTGCCTIDRKNYETGECFSLADSGCKKLDKSVGVVLAKGCVDSHKEIRAEKRLTTCKTNWSTWKFSSQRECQLYLDPK